MNRMKIAQYTALGAAVVSVFTCLPVIPVRKAYKEGMRWNL